jgi:hypothetical protein
MNDPINNTTSKQSAFVENPEKSRAFCSGLAVFACKPLSRSSFCQPLALHHAIRGEFEHETFDLYATMVQMFLFKIESSD